MSRLARAARHGRRGVPPARRGRLRLPGPASARRVTAAPDPTPAAEPAPAVPDARHPTPAPAPPVSGWETVFDDDFDGPAGSVAGPVAQHARDERGRAERAGPARGRAPLPDPHQPGVDPPRRHPGPGDRQPPHARHRQQLRRLLGAAPQRRRSARDRRDRELRPAQAGGSPVRLPHLLRRHPGDRRQRVRGHRAGARDDPGRPRCSPPGRSRGARSGATPPSSPSVATRCCSRASDTAGNRAYEITSSPDPRRVPGNAAPIQLRLSNKDVAPEHAVAGGTRHSMLVDWVTVEVDYP